MTVTTAPAAVPLLAATVAQVFGYTVLIILYVPYVPFEFAIGSWILIMDEGFKLLHEQAQGTRPRHRSTCWPWNMRPPEACPLG